MPGPARRTLAVALLGLVCLGAATAAAAPAHHYPKAVSDAFVRGCIRGGGTASTCRCVITTLERRDSYAKFKRLVLRTDRSGGKLPPELRSVALKCGRRHQ